MFGIWVYNDTRIAIEIRNLNCTDMIYFEYRYMIMHEGEYESDISKKYTN